MITNEFEQYLIEDVLKKISEDFPKNLDWKHNTKQIPSFTFDSLMTFLTS
jgi:thiamine phosphate synthase YjbQ (UPF0047 family)